MSNGYADSGYVDDGYWDGAQAGAGTYTGAYSMVVRSRPTMFGRTGTMECIKLFEKSANLVENFLADEEEKAVTDATVLFTLVDQNQEPVPGLAYPQTMQNEGDGRYSINLPSSLEIVRGENYWAQFASSSLSKGPHYQETLAICVVNRR